MQCTGRWRFDLHASACEDRASASRGLGPGAGILGIEGASPSPVPLFPQRVCWLLHRKVLRASPADAAEAAGEGFGCDPSR